MTQKVQIFTLAGIIVVTVLIFGIFKYSEPLGIVHIDSFNSLFMVPFVCTLIFTGVLLTKGKNTLLTPKNTVSNLTEREFEIATLILKGKKNREISAFLFVELSTVKTHINNIYKKLGVKNREELFNLKEDFREHSP